MMSTVYFNSIIHSTVKLLEEHNYYGLNRENVTIMKQNGVPAILAACECKQQEEALSFFSVCKELKVPVEPKALNKIAEVWNQERFLNRFTR